MVKRHHGLGRFLGFIGPRGRGHRRIPNVLGVGWDGRNHSYWTIRARGPGGGGAYHHGTHRLAPSAGWVRILGNFRLDDGLDGATDGTTLLRFRRRSMRGRPLNRRPLGADMLFSRAVESSATL